MGLCQVLNDFDFSWHGTTRPDQLDDELTMAMAQAGCYMLACGIETGSPELLQRMKKDLDLGAALRGREACRRAGIQFTALMMSGFPGQGARAQAETEGFLAKLQPDGQGNVGCTMVFPGTALYQECKRNGLIDDSFWLGPEPYYVYKGGLD